MNQKEEQGGIVGIIVLIVVVFIGIYNYFKDQQNTRQPWEDVFPDVFPDVSPKQDYYTPNASPNVTPIQVKIIDGGMQIKLCQVSVVLAYLASIYIISTIYYLIVSRSYGTPFKDALEKYPELKKIKMKSAHERGNAFYGGLAIGVISMVILKPFGDCF